jgi:hypothetical protein
MMKVTTWKNQSQINLLIELFSHFESDSVLIFLNKSLYIQIL